MRNFQQITSEIASHEYAKIELPLSAFSFSGTVWNPKDAVRSFCSFIDFVAVHNNRFRTEFEQINGRIDRIGIICTFLKLFIIPFELNKADEFCTNEQM